MRPNGYLKGGMSESKRFVLLTKGQYLMQLKPAVTTGRERSVAICPRRTSVEAARKVLKSVFYSYRKRWVQYASAGTPVRVVAIFERSMYEIKKATG